jgi:Pyruvate carboxylase
MRAAHNEPSLKSAFHSARHEAQKAFGNDQVYLEKLSSIRATLNFKSWPIAMATSSILANAIAQFNGVTKK